MKNLCKFKYRPISLILTFVITASALISASAAYAGDRYISSQGACVLDFDTGEVIYEHNGYIGRSPASMTKVMSLYCIYREMAKREISYTAQVPLSRKVLDMPVVTNYQCIPLYSGTSYTVDELLGAVATYSAANALMALCEFISGSEKEFVSLMNSVAGELGLDARYYDCCGGYTNFITPVSMARLARCIISEFPDIIERTSERYIDFGGRRYYSTNKLYTSYPYSGTDGLKTGTSTSAGYCFCGTAVRNGRRIISVTMCSSSNENRFLDTINLFDYGFEYIFKSGICYTDIKAYIDGVRIPAFLYKDNFKSTAVIIAEDLSHYGFDMAYDAQSRTVTAELNKYKEFIPLPANAYEGAEGETAFEVYDSKGFSVIIKENGNEHIISDVIRLDGYLAIPLDEIASIFNYKWDCETKSGYITR